MTYTDRPTKNEPRDPQSHVNHEQDMGGQKAQTHEQPGLETDAQKDLHEDHPEIALDSPCGATCTHPEHQKNDTEKSFQDKWLRAVAESENLRRRLEKEKQEGIAYALFRFGKEIINVADQLSWAVASAPISHGEPDALLQGVSMTLSALERVLEQFSIVKIDALHQAFNPHVHQVMQEQEDADHAPGTVLQILQNGYTMHDRLLRPAMVIVAKASHSS